LKTYSIIDIPKYGKLYSGIVIPEWGYFVKGYFCPLEFFGGAGCKMRGAKYKCSHPCIFQLKTKTSIHQLKSPAQSKALLTHAFFIQKHKPPNIN